MATVALDVVPAPPDPLLERLAPTNAAYVSLVQRARTVQREADRRFDDVKALNVVQAQGKDKSGRPVFLFFPGHLPAGFDVERVVMYAVLLMHPAVVERNEPYSAVWMTNNIREDAQSLGYRWFRRQYMMLPDAYRTNLHMVAIVHPTLSVSRPPAPAARARSTRPRARRQVRLLLLALSYVIRFSFWEKLLYADRIEFLDELLEPSGLQLPQEVQDYDRFLDVQMAQTSTDLAQASGTFSPLTGMGSDATATPERSFELYADQLRREREREAARPSDAKWRRDEEESESESEDDEGPAIEEVGEDEK
jgi:hypothetical protein